MQLLLLLLRVVWLGAAGQGGHFVMTGSVKSHLHNLARAALIGRFPILLQVIICSTTAYSVLIACAAAHKIRTQLIVHEWHVLLHLEQRFTAKTGCVKTNCSVSYRQQSSYDDLHYTCPPILSTP